MSRFQTTLLSTAVFLALGAAVATATNSGRDSSATAGASRTGNGAPAPTIVTTSDGTIVATNGEGTGTNGTTPGTTPVPGTDGTSSGTAPVVVGIMETTQPVPASATAVTAFTVPAGQRLVVTDVLVTNPNPAATCGLSVNRATGQSVTGVLCIPAQSTLSLALTTGLEFAESEMVLLANAATDITTPLSIHLRGFLVVASTTPTMPGTGTPTTPGTGTPGTGTGTTPGNGGTTPGTGGTTPDTTGGDTTGGTASAIR
jgi:hypothetical protein